MNNKIAAIVEAIEASGCETAVLSAFGCGAFGHPPELVAEMFHKHLARLSDCSVTFAIFDDHNAGRHHNPQGNFMPFSAMFSDQHHGRLRGQGKRAREA